MINIFSFFILVAVLKSHSSQWNCSHDEKFRGHDPENLGCHLCSV